MADQLVYVSRLVRLPLIDTEGGEIGRVADVVLGAPPREGPPRVHGFVVAVQRRRVFVGGNRVAELTGEGARLRRGAINMRQFAPQPGETLVVGEIFGRRAGDARGRRLYSPDTRGQLRVGGRYHRTGGRTAFRATDSARRPVGGDAGGVRGRRAARARGGGPVSSQKAGARKTGSARRSSRW